MVFKIEEEAITVGLFVTVTLAPVTKSTENSVLKLVGILGCSNTTKSLTLYSYVLGLKLTTVLILVFLSVIASIVITSPPNTVVVLSADSTVFMLLTGTVDLL